MSRKKDRIIVTAGLEKNMAVESPSGNLKYKVRLHSHKIEIRLWSKFYLETACITERRRKPPRAP